MPVNITSNDGLIIKNEYLWGNIEVSCYAKKLNLLK